MQVFISYSHASRDNPLAKRVAEVLKSAGFEVWDDSQILPGENWHEKTAKALQDSEAMVVLLTPDSLQTGNIAYETGYALGQKDYKGRVVSLATTPPEQIRNRIPWILHKLPIIHLKDRSNPDEGLRELARLLREAA